MSGTRTAISATKAGSLLKMDRRTIQRWIELGYLRGEQRGRRWWTTPASVEAARARLLPTRRASARG